MVILSVDYGDARTGIAVCDKNELLASPVCVISERKIEKIIERTAEIAHEKGAEEICVGLPKNMDGTEGFRAQTCREFASAIEKHSGVRTVLWDERLTTVSAHRFLSMNDVKGDKRKKNVDAVSAVIILEDYLAFRKHHG